ncbi:MAG: putative 4-hydroxybenzoate polyprenyltransferase [Verrucomicrobia bacterium]|nr:putative 4-hydroxybenzoate polyprenyltransferase [Verrucomicrobiota bacterium]
MGGRGGVNAELVPRPSSLLSVLKTWGAFVRFSHTVFALPFALAAMVVAARDQGGWPGGRTFALILLAMVSARTCAMTFNRIADREFDRLNPRTAMRHLPTGRVSLAGAWTLWFLSAAGLVSAAGLLNRLCLFLSPVALVVICFYSLTKRFTPYTHFFLGLALALAPIGAWLAVRGNFAWWPLRDGAVLPLLLAAAVIFWLVGFDIIYALQDYEFDRRHGLHSLVVAWGPRNALKAAFLSHMLMCELLAVFGLLARFRIAYLVGLILILLSLLLEHWLARRRSLKWIHTAFFRLNALISVIFLVVTVAEVVFHSGFKLR